MPDNIGQATGAALQALPIDKMISAPLMAAIGAQIRSSRQYLDFIREVGLENGKAVMVDFEYDEDVLDGEGAVTATRNRKMKVPLLALVTHPNVNVEQVTVDFEMTIETSEEQRTETSGEGGFEAKIGWGPFSVKVHGKVSHKSEQTRKTDTRAKYSFHVEAKRDGPPEGMMRVLDALVDEATRPKLAAATPQPQPATN